MDREPDTIDADGASVAVIDTGPAERPLSELAAAINRAHEESEPGSADAEAARGRGAAAGRGRRDIVGAVGATAGTRAT